MSQLVELTSGSVRWHIDPDVACGTGADALFQADAPCVSEWLRDGQATVVKHGPHQSVYHLVLPGLDCYLKHYRSADARAWLRSLVRPAKASLEFTRTRLAAARGLPTLTPLAAGESAAQDGTRSSYLVTRTLHDAVPLDRFLETTLPTLAPARQSRLRQRIAVTLGQLLAAMHGTGVVYRDLHPGNLLLRLDADNQPHLYLIDIYAVRFWPRLTARQRRDNLVILNRWFILRSGRTDRLRCWRAYQKAWHSHDDAVPVQTQSTGQTARELERTTVASNLQFWQHLDRRCLANNRRFQRVRRGEVAGHVVTDLQPELLARLLTNPDALFREPGAQRLKDSPSSTVIELEPRIAGTGKALIFKRFAVTRWSDPWVSLVRPTPALRSFVHGHGLVLRCLPTPRPLAVLHRQRHGLRHEGYLLTEKVENAVDLLAHVNGLLSGTAPGAIASLRELIVQVARLVGTLHHRRLSHRDLKAANLLVHTDPLTRVPTIWFIDLVGVARHRRLGRGRRVQNLARLHASFLAHSQVTRTDKLRFLRAYLCWGLRGKAGWKTWWLGIEEATRAKVARNRRNRRPLG